jgi:TetR/AcrR family transcriptional regulator, cholesterol catabolism regulator
VAQALQSRTPRRAELVRAAARLFSERGYHGTSMQHLGDALGLQRGSLYAHIGGKEDLLFDVVDEGADRFIERGNAAATMQAKASVKLQGFLQGHVATAIEHLDAATVFLNEWRYLSPELKSIVKDKRDRYESMLTDIIRSGIADGEFRTDADVQFAVLLTLSAGNWVYEWYRPEGELSPEQIADRFTNLILTGLREMDSAGPQIREETS